MSRTKIPKKKLVGQFYVVTAGRVWRSLYRVLATNPRRCGNPSVQKIRENRDDLGIPDEPALGDSIPVGAFLGGGTALAICSFVMMYVPEGSGGRLSGHSSFVRMVESVNTQYWGDRTGLVVGIFRTLEPAERCFYMCGPLRACDPRWENSTREVLRAIGDEHPNFYVSHSPRLCLRLFEK